MVVYISTLAKMPPLSSGGSGNMRDNIVSVTFRDYPRQGQNPHARGARPFEGLGAGVNGGAGGHHVVDQDDPAARHGASRTDGEGAAYIFEAAVTGQVYLAFRIAGADQQVGLEGEARARGDLAGEQGRLVVAPAEQAPAMERHRRHRVGVGQQVRAAARHPGGECRRSMGAVAVLKTAHQRAGGAVEADHRAGLIEVGWPAEAGAAKAVRAFIEGEGQTAALAIGGGDKIDRRPAFTAQAPRHIDRRRAGETARRQEDIQQTVEPASRRGWDCAAERHGFEYGQCVGDFPQKDLPANSNTSLWAAPH